MMPYLKPETHLKKTSFLVSIPDLPVTYIFGTKLPGKPIYQVTIDPWFQIYGELEDAGMLDFGGVP